MIRPNPTNPTGFEYPVDCLLKPYGTIPANEMRNPPILDQNSDPCLIAWQHH